VLVPVPEWLRGWAARDHCARGPVEFISIADVIAQRWSRCAGSAEVIHYRIVDGGHAWPGAPGATRTVDATALIWGFFRAHPSPPA
jgi:polyhydroxybutyrate depolymerase